MQILRITLLAFVLSLLTTAKAAENVIKLTDALNTEMVTINSSEPPATPIINSKKPTWVNDDTGQKMDAANNMWYSLEKRETDIRVGGFGDQYEVFMRFPGITGAVNKATLRLYATGPAGSGTRVHEIELRKVTTADPLPIEKKRKESWSPQKIRYAMRPSSKYFSTVPIKGDGWIEIDITELVKAWAVDPFSNHGIHIVANEHRNNWLHFAGPKSEKNPPELIIRN